MLSVVQERLSPQMQPQDRPSKALERPSSAVLETVYGAFAGQPNLSQGSHWMMLFFKAQPGGPHTSKLLGSKRNGKLSHSRSLAVPGTLRQLGGSAVGEEAANTAVDLCTLSATTLSPKMFDTQQLSSSLTCLHPVSNTQPSHSKYSILNKYPAPSRALHPVSNNSSPTLQAHKLLHYRHFKS